MSDTWMGSIAAQDKYEQPLPVPQVADEGGSNVMGAIADATGNVVKGLYRDIPRAAQWFYGQASKPEAEAQADVRGALHDVVSLPKRAIENSQYSLDTGNYDPKVPVEAALTLAGGALPWAEKGAAGVFGGRLAKTADIGKLEEAQLMLKTGNGPNEIFARTGWFRGADDKWRFEIPDTASKWGSDPRNAERVFASDKPPMVGGVFDHPELYAAYPQLYNADLNIQRLGGNVKGSYQAGGQGSPPTISLAPDRPSSMRSTALHELQHGVQDIEGFATGGNNFALRPNTPAWDIYQERLKAMKTPLDKETYGKVAGYGDDVVPDKDYEEYLKIIKKPSPVADRAAQEYAATSYYQRLTGEVEARNVQKRADMPPEELRTTHPQKTQDFPDDMQFVKYRAGAGPQMSKVLAPEMEMGSVPQGTHKNWLLRYSPSTGAPELVNQSGATGNAFTTLKGVPVPNPSSRVLANEPAPYQYPQIDMAKLQRDKASLVFGPTDRMYGGGELIEGGGTKFATPVKQEGGVNYPHMHRDVEIPNVPKDAVPLYASVTRKAANDVNEIAAKEIEKGRTPYYTPLIMTHGAGDSSKQMVSSVHQAVRQREPNAAAIEKIDEAVRAKLKEGKQRDSYPGFANEEQLNAWLNRGLPERTGFTKGMDTKSVKSAVDVDVGALRYANTDPRLLHTPSGSGGILMGKMRPDVGLTEHPLHSNYPQTFFGQKGEVGGAPGNIPFSLLAPDMHRPLVPQSNQGVSFATTPAIQVMRGMSAEVPKAQKVTQEVVDNWYEWFRRHPQGWGIAAGAPVIGGLAAQDNYRRD